MWNISKNVGRHPVTTFEKTSMYIGADIALLELLEEVDLSVYTPVCLPSSVKNRDNTPALAIGKGRVLPWEIIIITIQAGAR